MKCSKDWDIKNNVSICNLNFNTIKKMKNIVKLVVAIALVALCSNISAQTLKLAHINKQELVMSMPEYDSASVKLQKFAQDLESAIEEMNVELNRKTDDWTKNQANWTDLVKQSKLDEIQSIQTRISTFQQQAQESFGQEQQKLMQPVIEKADKAIDAVAKEQGVTYVINGDSQILVFKAVGTLDLLPAVKQHLGIKN